MDLVDQILDLLEQVAGFFGLFHGFDEQGVIATFVDFFQQFDA